MSTDAGRRAALLVGNWGVPGVSWTYRVELAQTLTSSLKKKVEKQTRGEHNKGSPLWERFRSSTRKRSQFVWPYAACGVGPGKERQQGLSSENLCGALGEVVDPISLRGCNDGKAKEI